MAVDWRFSEGLLYIEGDDEATPAESEAAIAAALASPEYRPGTGLLHDARRRATGAPSAAQVKARVLFLVRQAHTYGVTRWATVVVDSASYGMGRMAEVLTTQLADSSRPVEFRVFTDLAEAEAWLREPPTPR